MSDDEIDDFEELSFAEITYWLETFCTDSLYTAEDLIEFIKEYDLEECFVPENELARKTAGQILICSTENPEKCSVILEFLGKLVSFNDYLKAAQISLKLRQTESFYLLVSPEMTRKRKKIMRDPVISFWAGKSQLKNERLEFATEYYRYGLFRR